MYLESNFLHKYISTHEQLEDCLNLFKDLEIKEIALDTETSHDPSKPSTKYGFADPFTNLVRLIQIKGHKTESYVLDILKLQDNSLSLSLLKEFLSDPNKLFVLHNAKFDYKMLKVNLGVSLNNVWDTMIASQLIGHACGTQFGKARGHDLKSVLKDFSGVILNKAEQISYWGGSLTAEQLEYAANDVMYILPLKETLLKILETPFPEGLDMKMATQDEMNLIPVLAEMELNGIAFNREVFKLVQTSAKAALPSLVNNVCKNFGIGIQRGLLGVSPAINLDSPAQLLKVLIANGIEIEDTEADTLEEASKAYPKLVDLIEYKKLSKALTFPYDEFIHPITHRIHPSYNQLGAGTSRLSCSEPNLQQVPKLSLKIPDKYIDQTKHMIYLNKKASEKADKDIYMISYRCCFVSPTDYLFGDFDYSGQELCVVAAASGDKTMCKILSQPEKLPDGSKNPAADLHSIVGSEMFGVPVLDIMNGAQNSKGVKYRDDSKIVSFGNIYGKQAVGFAKDWGVSENEAKRFLKRYFKKFPDLKKYLDRIGAIGEMTRLSRFPEFLPESRLRFLNDNGKSDKGAILRAAYNTPIQGTSAIMIKKALVKIYHELKSKDPSCKLVLTVHDEIAAELPKNNSEFCKNLIKNSMEEVANYFLGGKVPGRAEAKVGNNWDETH